LVVVINNTGDNLTKLFSSIKKIFFRFCCSGRFVDNAFYPYVNKQSGLAAKIRKQIKDKVW